MRRILLLTTALLLCGGCFTPGYLSPWIPESTPDRQHVLVFGDSLSYDSYDEALTVFGADPNIAMSHNSFGATTVNDWLDEIKQIPAGTTVVMALGTNDIHLQKGDLDIWKMLEALNIMHSGDVNCVVWLTLSTDTADRFGGERGAETYKYNTALRTVDGYSTQYPNLWLQDWDAMSEGHDEYYDWANNDWLHHGPEGELAYAQAQYDAINRCGGN